MSIHPDDGSTAYECPHHFDCAGECTLTDVPLPGTVATWLADIERYKAANTRLLAALQEAREDLDSWAACASCGSRSEDDNELLGRCRGHGHLRSVLAAMSEHVTHVEQLDAPIDVIANAIAADKGYTTAEGFHDVAAIILGCLVGAGFRIVRAGPYDEVHLIEFRDDGWTIQHTLTERVDGLLFDCPRGNWNGGDPGVRGRFVLNEDGTIGEAVTS